MHQTDGRLSLLLYPYTSLLPVMNAPSELRSIGLHHGPALVWRMGVTPDPNIHHAVAHRPGGVSLIVLIPPCRTPLADVGLLHGLSNARPQGILPYHPGISPWDLAEVLKRPPEDLGGEITEYLRWRGLGMDTETSRLVRRIIDLSAELRSVAAVCRSIYMSRRALGRQLLTRGLPAPSRWLHIGRVLRAVIRLQNTDSSVSSVAYELGYADGFSFSNQMERLTGFRPSQARERFGWEWVLESWLKKEADRGGLTPTPKAAGAPKPGPRRENRHLAFRPERSQTSEAD
jgi:AraC-like DNA-binding protein